MSDRQCKFSSDKDRYGHFPLKNRFALDQVPLEVNNRNTTIEQVGTDIVHIQGPRKDLTKRQATLQLCVRVQGEQIVRGTIIFFNKNPAENRYELPPGLASRTVTFEGKQGREDEFYDDSVDVMWDPKAWASQPISKQWFEKFIEQTEHLKGPQVDYDMDDAIRTPKIAVQADNLSCQNVEDIREMCWNEEIFIVNTPANCTDCTAVIDDGPGKLIKGDMQFQF